MIRILAGWTAFLSLLLPVAQAEDVPLGGPTSFLPFSFTQARELIGADIDKDGDMDVVTVSQQPSGLNDPAKRVVWLENVAGDGSSWTQRTIDDAFGDGTFVTVGDVNSDGFIDVLATRLNNTPGADALVWYVNDGSPANDSSWVKNTIAPIPMGSDFASPIGCWPADIDRDGDIDVVLAHTSLGSSSIGDEVVWFENIPVGGNIAWAVHTIDAAVEDPAIVTVGDINRDGWPDVATVAQTDGAIVWYANDQDPQNSGVWAEQPIDSSFSGARNLVLADMNRDGFLDVVACARTAGEVAWWKGDGGFTWVKQPVSSGVPQAIALSVTDFDLDGDPDIFVGTDNSGTPAADDSIVWFENANAVGTSWTPHNIESATVDRVSSVATADLDGDGDADLMASIFAGNNVRWYENLSVHRSAGFPTATTVESTLAQFRSVATADVDLDGKPDAVGASVSGNTVAWWRNTADGATWTKNNVDTTFAAPASVIAGDINGDGFIDIAAVSSSTNAVSWWRNLNGLGTSWAARDTIDSSLIGPSSIVLGDLDRDSFLDIIVCGTGGAVNWYENRLDLSQGWTSHSVTSGLAGASSVAVGDVNGDGIPDVVVAAQTLGAVRWYQSDGTPGDPGSFTERVVDNSAAGVASISLGDADRDGDLDIYAARPGSATAAVYLNDNGMGTTWTQSALDGAALAAFAVQPADFDRDGDLDVFISGSTNNGSAYGETMLPGVVSTGYATAAGLTNPTGVARADFNGDGFPDVLVGATNGMQALLNAKGYFRATGMALSAPGDMNGDVSAVLRVTALHSGRAGEPNLDWRNLSVKLTTEGGVNLTTQQANALLSSLDLYLDNGDDTFNSATDTLVVGAAPLALTGGVQALSIGDADPDALLTPGTARTYFIVASFQADAGDQTPSAFVISLLGTGGTAEITGTSTVRAQTGAPTVESALLNPGRDPADVNGDGSVNAVDVQLVINGALGLDVGGFVTDINGDSATNAVDVQLVINAVLGIG